MPTDVANISWTFVPGSVSTLVEFRVTGTIPWIIPSSPTNPTPTNTYPLTINTDTEYDVRLTTNGLICSPRSMTFNILSGTTTTTTSTSTSSTTSTSTTSTTSTSTTTTTSTTHSTTTTTTTTTSTSSTTTTTTTVAGPSALVSTGSSNPEACSGVSEITVFWSGGAITAGTHLFTNSGLTTPATGFSIMELIPSGHDPCGELYTVNPGTGVVIANTGSTCCDITEQVLITNNSTLITPTGVSVNSNPISGASFPVTSGNNTTGVTDQLGTFTITVDVTVIGIGDSVDIVDSGLTHHCQDVTSSGTLTFPGCVINNINAVQINANTGSC